MESILRELKNNHALKLIGNLTQGCPQEIYLVGGALRDLFLKRKKEVPDFDFAVSSSAIALSRKIAQKLQCPLVILDKRHGSSRIIYKKNDFSCNFDFTDFRGKDIAEDLLHRDFTINSLAVNVKAIKNAKNINDILIDNFSARKDIRAKTIRIISEFSFPEDPLRILRAFSLSAVLNFRCEAKTKSAIRKYKGKISSSAFERITEELFKILNSENGFKIIKAMDALKVLDEFMPEIKSMRKVNQGPYHHLDVYGHSLETLKQIERLFAQLKMNKDIQGYVNQVISATHTKRGLLKLGAFLHDIGKPVSKERVGAKTCFHGHERAGRNIVREISERLRLSNDERSALDKIIFWHLRPGYMADIEPLTHRATYRFFRDAQDEAVSILLLSIADQRSTRGSLTRGENRRHHEAVCLGLVKEYFRKKRERKFPKLLNGFEVMKHFKLSPGPFIGKILREIEEAQAIGEIEDKKEALEVAKRIIQEKK